jgi:ATP/ADP translocase
MLTAPMSIILMLLKKILFSLLLQDDLFWRQRAKTFWNKDEDLTLSSSMQLLLCSWMIMVVNVAMQCFINLFQKKHGSRNAVLNALTQSVTSDDNQKLTSPFTIEEFKDAAFFHESR